MVLRSFVSFRAAFDDLVRELFFAFFHLFFEPCIKFFFASFLGILDPLFLEVFGKPPRAELSLGVGGVFESIELFFLFFDGFLKLLRFSFLSGFFSSEFGLFVVCFFFFFPDGLVHFFLGVGEVFGFFFLFFAPIPVSPPIIPVGWGWERKEKCEPQNEKNDLVS